MDKTDITEKRYTLKVESINLTEESCYKNSYKYDTFAELKKNVIEIGSECFQGLPDIYGDESSLILKQIDTFHHANDDIEILTIFGLSPEERFEIIDHFE